MLMGYKTRSDIMAQLGSAEIEKERALEEAEKLAQLNVGHADADVMPC